MARRNWELEINNVINFFMSKKEGVIIKHSAIENIVKFSQYENEYLYIITKVKQELIKKGIILKTVMFKGYEILPKEEIPDYLFNRYLISSVNMQEKIINIIKFLDKSKFDEKSLKKLNELKSLTININEYSSNEIVKSKLLLSNAKKNFLN